MAGGSRIEQALGQRVMSNPESLRVGIASRVQGATQQVDMTKANKASQLAKAFSSAGSIYNQVHERVQKDREDQYDKTISRLMTENSPEQFRQLMQDNQVPQMDDPVFRKALYFKLGSQAAFDVDKEISERISKGEFDGKTKEDVFKARSEAVNNLRKSAWETYGFSPDDPTFSEGLSNQALQRNVAITEAFTGRRSEVMKNQAYSTYMEGAKGIIDSGSPDLGSALGAYVQSNYIDGMSGDLQMTKSSAVAISTAMAEKGVPYEQLEAFWDTRLRDGVQVGSMVDPTMRQKLKEHSESRLLGSNVQNRAALMTTLSRMSVMQDVDAAIDQSEQLLMQIGQAQGGYATEQYMMVEQTRNALVEKRARALEKEKVEAEKQAASDYRVANVVTNMEAAVEGEDTNMPPGYWNAKPEERAAAAQQINQMIEDDPQLSPEDKLTKKVRLAITDPNGFFAEAMNVQVSRSNGAVRALAETGEMSEVQQKELASTLGLVRTQPQLAAQVMDKDTYRQFAWLNRSRELGLDPRYTAKVLMDEQEAAKSPELYAQRRAEFQAAATKDNQGLAKFINVLPADAEEDVRTYYMINQASGMPAGQNAKETNKYFKDNYMTLETNGWSSNTTAVIPNEWLYVSGWKDETKRNQDYVKKQVEALGGADNVVIQRGQGRQDESDVKLKIQKLNDDSPAGTVYVTEYDLLKNYADIDAENVKQNRKVLEEKEKEVRQIVDRNEWNTQRRQAAESRKNKRETRKRLEYLRYKKAQGLLDDDGTAELQALLDSTQQ